MTKGKYKCPKCDRTFSMPAHLARHKNTIHSMGSRKKTAAKKMGKTRAKVGRPKRVSAKRVGRPKGRVARRGVSVGLGTPRFLGEMQAYRSALLTQRASLDVQIDAVGRALGEMGLATKATPTRRTTKKRAKPKVKARPRAKAKKGPAVGKIRAGSLRDYIGRVLRQRSTPMSPAEIGTGVVRAGFKTKSKDITKAVSNTLPKMTNIKKMGFGKYQVTG